MDQKVFKSQNASFDYGNVNIKWFEDGTLNVSANCIDRHLKTRAEQTAIIFEPDNPEEPAQHITYAALHENTCRMANVLKDLGVEKGTEGTRTSVEQWMKDPLMWGSEYLWPGRFHDRLHISTRQYARIVRDWVTSIGLEPTAYGTHTMRRTKVTQIYKKTGNLRAVQLLLGHTKMDSTVRYLGVELEDALAISEAIEI